MLKSISTYNKTLLISLLAFLTIQTSCTIPIKLVLKKTDKLNGKTVRVKGTIISSVELSDIKCFTIKDRTEKICVVTNNLLPLKRDYIKVKGILNINYQYKKQQMIVIEEKQMKLKKLKIYSTKKIKRGSKVEY
ncbi:MAG: hypothetical protein JXR51_00455 [Bacteroidales bacterium]|nr:hypothetical protein [Bacteroidales bacterium]MBN2755611.1 hypothetical protein [Bacteroidales bacterium]